MAGLICFFFFAEPHVFSMGLPEMFRIGLFGMIYSIQYFHFTQCTLHWLLFFCLCTSYFTLLSGWLNFLSLASGVNAHICHTGILIYQLYFLWFSYLFSCAIAVYLTLFAIISCIWGTNKQWSPYPHCHMSAMDVFCISKFSDCLYDNKMFLTFWYFVPGPKCAWWFLNSMR